MKWRDEKCWQAHLTANNWSKSDNRSKAGEKSSGWAASSWLTRSGFPDGRFSGSKTDPPIQTSVPCFIYRKCSNAIPPTFSVIRLPCQKRRWSGLLSWELTSGNWSICIIRTPESWGWSGITWPALWSIRKDRRWNRWWSWQTQIISFFPKGS